MRPCEEVGPAQHFGDPLAPARLGGHEDANQHAQAESSWYPVAVAAVAWPKSTPLPPVSTLFLVPKGLGWPEILPPPSLMRSSLLSLSMMRLPKRRAKPCPRQRLIQKTTAESINWTYTHEISRRSTVEARFLPRSRALAAPTP